MYPATHAALRPEQLATVMAGSGESVTYAELDSGSNRCAHYLRRLGLRPGDHIAILLENHPRFHEICWAAQRSGLYYTAVNWHLRPDEVGAVVRSCGARVLFTSQVLAATAVTLLECAPDMSTRLMLDGVATGYRSYEEATAPLPTEPISDEVEGADLLYSSGTTGRPKGVRVPLSGRHPAEPSPARERLSDLSGFGADTVFLATAPLYHAASLGWSLRVHRRGGTVVVMERFDPEAALAAIERHQVTHAHVVPTMFVRLLRLPADVRRRYDLSSLRSVAHSAGPCAPAVKEQMIAWWGPIIDELYGGTERNGLTFITSSEWLAHRGSVGCPVYGHVHILDEAGRVLPPGDVGTVYFGGGGSFEYLGDPEGTARSLGPNGWTTIGDLGYVDADGYLYLVGRRDRIIVSGGVNIQPQELEDVLSAYPGVTDAAVLGVPDEEMGTRVAALVVPAEPVTSPERAAGLVEALQAHCHRHLAGFKCPRTIDLVPDLPRDTTGKLPEERLLAVYCDLKSAHPASRRRAPERRSPAGDTIAKEFP